MNKSHETEFVELDNTALADVSGGRILPIPPRPIYPPVWWIIRRILG